MVDTRNRYPTRIALLCATILASAVSAPVWAQATPRADADSSDIIVTATKREERLRDVAMAVSALSGQELLDRQALGFADYAARIPSLSLQQISPTANRITIRGLNAGGSGSTVAVYLDDSPVGSSTTLAGGSVFTNNNHPWDIARVEVLRGPQGTLYGANAQGGLLKFVSTPPDLSNLTATAQVGFESISGGETGVQLRGTINAPLVDGKLALRVSGFYDQLPGFIDDIARGKKNENSGYRQGFRASLLFKPAENFSVRLTAFHQATQANGLSYVGVVGSSRTYANPPSNKFDPVGNDLNVSRATDENVFGRLTNISASLVWSFAGVTLTSVSSYADMENRNRTDSSYSTFTINPGSTTPDAPRGLPVNTSQVVAGVYGAGAGARTFDIVPVKKYTQELRLSSNADGNFSWQLGAFYTHEDARLYQPLEGFSLATDQALSPAAGATDLLSKYTEYAAFGTVTYKFTPNFDVEAGGRVAQNKQSNDNFFAAGPFTGGPFRTFNASSETAWTYSVAPRWRINPNTLLFGRIATGFRPGGPNNITTIAPLPANFPLQYRSDSTVNYEAGFRTQAFGGALSIDVGAFLINWKDIQLNTRFGNFTVRANGGSATSKGLEWTFGLKPLSGLTFSWNGSYVDARLGTISAADSALLGAAQGDRLPYVPDWSTALDAEYRFAITERTKSFIGATVSYVGNRTTDFSPNTYLNPQTALPTYTTLALRAGVSLENWRLQAFVNNLTDVRGITIYQNSGAANGAGIKGIIQPRSFGLSLTANFH